MKNTFTLLFCLFLFIGCKNDKKEDPESTPSTKTEKSSKENKAGPAKKLAEIVETAHHKSDFKTNKAVSFRLDLTFDGQQRLEARISLLTNSSKVKVEKADGTTLIYDGKNALLFPNTNTYKEANFDLWAWANFFSLPFRLTDPGTQWLNKSQDSIGDEAYNTAELALKKENGPKQDFVVYADKKTDFLTAATYNKPGPKTSEKNRAIVYKNYFTLKHVPVAKYWEFHRWSKTKGVHGPVIGRGEISRVKFFNPPEGFFTAPKDAVHIND